jgi:hypothetical protein
MREFMGDKGEFLKKTFYNDKQQYYAEWLRRNPQMALKQANLLHDLA